MPPFVDLTGQKFSRLTVMARGANTYDARVRWHAKCECGQEILTRGDQMIRKMVQSCGCLHRDYLKVSKIGLVKLSHGASKTVEYKTYKACRSRCNNPRFIRWHGRGIKFLFNSFEEFFAEVGLRPSPKHSIDRIDNDGNYEPGNIRWATAKEQANNTRKRRRKA